MSDELAARFDLREERFTHGGCDLTIQLPVSSEALIDVSDFNVDERLPYWAELWPSARALARTVLDAERLPPRAIELGCGVALPSLALRYLGVHVLATDYYRDALRVAARNAERNGLGPLPTRELDWRKPPGHLARFPLVVAADVLYERRNVEPLADTIGRLAAPDAQVRLADPGRVYFEPFIEEMEGRGWRVARRKERTEAAPAPGRDARIRLVRFER